MMQTDIRLLYEQALDESHHGRPEIIQTVRTGNRGRPRIYIDPDFLRWAYAHRSTTGISRFLGVNRDTVRNALLDYGIAEPQQDPFHHEPQPLAVNTASVDERETDIVDDLLDPHIPLPTQIPVNLTQTNSLSFTHDNHSSEHPTTSFTGPLSTLSDDELDALILRLRSHFRRAGITMMDGMLRRLGHRLPHERIRASLMQIDPVQRVFQRIRIRRRVYSVHGQSFSSSYKSRLLTPKAGLIRWGIVIHGFIDGYSRLITGLQASDNNFGETVLDLFLRAAEVYGVPSRLRGDHGVENIVVAIWMEEHRGTRRGSYIWGR